MSDPKLWTYRARPVRVIDGDTLALLIDLGFGARYEADVRIAGIDTPELGNEDGAAAAVALGRLLAPAFEAAGWPLLVRTRKSRTGRDARSFARWIGDVHVAGHPPIDVAAAMVEAGHATRSEGS